MTETKTMVVLRRVPDGLLSGLPEEDCVAIRGAIGRRTQVVGCDERGWLELEFKHDGATHTIWADPHTIEPHDIIIEEDTGVDWTGCDLVQSHPGYLSGQWCLKSSPRMPADAIIVNWDAGHSVEELMEMWGLSRADIGGILLYARGVK